MTRTLMALAVLMAALAVAVSTATGAEVAPRKMEAGATVDLYKDPG